MDKQDILLSKKLISSYKERLENEIINRSNKLRIPHKLSKEIIEGNFATEEELKSIEKRIDAEISESVKNALDAPEPPSDELTKYIWAED